MKHGCRVTGQEVGCSPDVAPDPYFTIIQRTQEKQKSQACPALMGLRTLFGAWESAFLAYYPTESPKVLLSLATIL